MEKNSGSGGVQSLDRAFDLLELLCRSQNGMAIHQLSEITGLHKSTVHRLLAAMASRGYVRRDPENAVYRAGISPVLSGWSCSPSIRWGSTSGRPWGVPTP